MLFWYINFALLYFIMIKNKQRTQEKHVYLTIINDIGNIHQKTLNQLRNRVFIGVIYAGYPCDTHIHTHISQNA